MSACICSKICADARYLSLHQNICTKYQAHLATLFAHGAPRLQRRLFPKKKDSRPPGSQHSTSSSDSPSSLLIGSSEVPMDIDPLEPAQMIMAAAEEDIITDVHGRPIRSNRGILPSRFADFLPEGLMPLTPEDSDGPGTEMAALSPEIIPSIISETPGDLDQWKITRTKPNLFGLMREFIGPLPINDPDDDPTLMDFLVPDVTQRSHNHPNLNVPSDDPENDSDNPYAPYPNRSSFLLDQWFWNHAQKSRSDFDKLIEVLSDPSFILDDIKNSNWTSLRRDTGSSSSTNFDNRAAWKESSVQINVPVMQEPFIVENVFHKSLVDVVRAQFESFKSRRYHYVPHRLLWSPKPSDPSFPAVEVYGELYNSRAFINAHLMLQASPAEPGCTLPRNVAAIMLSSDATQLTNFGSAQLWPFYMQFGNQSKYLRGKPSERAMIHLAYIPKLPESLVNVIRTSTGKVPTKQLLTHCKRELIHAIWGLLLSDEVRNAYAHGIVVKCADDITRRLYLRFFTYSADYPEKCLLVTIRDMGQCPCPRCLIPLTDIHLMGTPSDLMYRSQHKRIDNNERRQNVLNARKLIHQDGYVVNSTKVDSYLKPQSLVPTENAFSRRLGDLGFDYHTLFVPDELHEWSLGILKQFFTHLVRIAYAQGKETVAELDRRYALVPAFGRDAIRSFGAATSSMSRFAARTYEDVLLCALPVFDGLLPEPHDSLVQDLIFITNYAHLLCKLRIHHDSTLSLLEAVTLEFCKLTRKFKQITCKYFHTAELPSEQSKRLQQHANKVRQAAANGIFLDATVPTANLTKKEYNLNTYKYHSVAGDYVSTIRTFGSVDSYSSRQTEREHIVSKSGGFERTSKKNFEAQLASMELRRQRLDEIEYATSIQKSKEVDGDHHLAVVGDLGVHHHIGASVKLPIDIGLWLKQHGVDRAVKDFLPRLKSHLLARLDGVPYDGTGLYAAEEHKLLNFRQGRMYEHRILRVNYTTYDIQRDQDVIKSTGVRRGIMTTGHPDSIHHADLRNRFYFAELLGIYHIHTIDLRKSTDSAPISMEFLFVRWFEHDSSWDCGGFQNLRLPRISYVPEHEENAFGFVDPSTVVRAPHLIPCFKLGRTRSLLDYSKLARNSADDDWKAFYVNIFGDKDILVRYIGGGIGHCANSGVLGLAFPRIATENIEESFLSNNATFVDDESDSDQSELEVLGESSRADND